MSVTSGARRKAQFSNQALDRATTSVEECINRLIGVYSTAPTSHLALIARVDGYEPSHLDELVIDRRSIVRMGAMRGSGYLIPTQLVPTVVRATEQRIQRVFNDLVGKMMDRKTYERLATKIEKIVAGTEMTTAEIRKAVRESAHDTKIRYVVQLMTTECRMVTTRTAGTWRSNLTYNALWSDWLPKVDPWKLSADKAKRDLAALYFAAHGPATIEDFAWWSGLGKEAAALLQGAKVPELGDGYYGTMADARPPKGVRLLPIWDPLFLTHKDRTHSVPGELYRHVYDRSGNPTSVVVVNGVAAGHWDLTVDKSHHLVKVGPFGSFSDTTKRQIEREVDRLARAFGAEDLELRWIRKVPPLREDWNRFMSPLKDL